jgi:RimJ/RimL family protein N-acetyltransferase
VFETERLHLHAFTESDADFLVDLNADPDVARFIGGDRLTTEASLRQVQRFATVWESHGYGQSILVTKDTPEAIGRVGLHPWPEWDELELGWALVRRRQGQGFAQEAARAWLDWVAHAGVAPYLIAVIDPANAPSIRLAERLGFTFDRTDETNSARVVIYRYDAA